MLVVKLGSVTISVDLIKAAYAALILSKLF